MILTVITETGVHHSFYCTVLCENDIIDAWECEMNFLWNLAVATHLCYTV